MEIFYPLGKDINNFNKTSLLNPTNCRVINLVKKVTFWYKKRILLRKENFLWNYEFICAKNNSFRHETDIHGGGKEGGAGGARNRGS